MPIIASMGSISANTIPSHTDNSHTVAEAYVAKSEINYELKNEIDNQILPDSMFDKKASVKRRDYEDASAILASASHNINAQAVESRATTIMIEDLTETETEPIVATTPALVAVHMASSPSSSQPLKVTAQPVSPVSGNMDFSTETLHSNETANEQPISNGVIETASAENRPKDIAIVESVTETVETRVTEAVPTHQMDVDESPTQQPAQPADSSGANEASVAAAAEKPAGGNQEPAKQDASPAAPTPADQKDTESSAKDSAESRACATAPILLALLPAFMLLIKTN